MKQERFQANSIACLKFTKLIVYQSMIFNLFHSREMKIYEAHFEPFTSASSKCMSPVKTSDSPSSSIVTKEEESTTHACPITQKTP